MAGTINGWMPIQYNTIYSAGFRTVEVRVIDRHDWLFYHNISHFSTLYIMQSSQKQAKHRNKKRSCGHFVITQQLAKEYVQIVKETYGVYKNVHTEHSATCCRKQQNVKNSTISYRTEYYKNHPYFWRPLNNYFGEVPEQMPQRPYPKSGNII